MDHESMILARQEAIEVADECDGDCTHCMYWKICDLCDVSEMEG